MATATARKPRTSVEAVPQLATLPERVGVVETKVESIKEQITDLKGDVREMHDCLDQTRDKVMSELAKMQEEYRSNSSKFFDHADKLHLEDQAAHDKLGTRIKDLESVKAKWTMYAMAALAFGAGSGLLHVDTLGKILKFLGL